MDGGAHGPQPVARAAAAIALATALALAAGSMTGCGDDDTTGNDTADGDGNTTAPPTTLSEEAEVEAAYLAYWEMLVRLSAAPDPNDEEISERAMGSARTEVIQGLANLAAQSQIARPGPDYAHSVESVEIINHTASVRDCAVDDSTIHDAENGEVIAGGVAATGLLEVTLEKEGGTWRVSRVETVQKWPGVHSCGS